MSDPAADLELALDAARRAGGLVMQWFRTPLDVHHKGPDQPVTAADLAADRMLYDLLSTARPAYGWLSEEGEARPERLARTRTWLVDPIDGTRSFIDGLPEFSISIGLAEDGLPVLGVILNPASGEVYWGVRGSGAWWATHEGEPAPLRVRAGTDGPALLIASRSEIRRGELARFEDHDAWRVRGLGSTALKLAHVAAGRADAYLSRGPRCEWDLCAGALLVELAGGRVSDGSGRPLHFNRADPFVRGVLAASAHMHESLKSLAGLAKPSG